MNAGVPARIVVVGLGRLGGTIVRSFGESVTGAVTSRPDEFRATFSDRKIALYQNLNQVPSESYDILWIAVPDRAIVDVGIAGGSSAESWNDKTVIHSSGATPLVPLEPFRERGASVAVLHPNAILSGEEPFPQGLVWGITLAGLSPQAIENLLAPFTPKLIHIEDSTRPLYHAAASLSANYTMTLFAAAQELYRKVGVQGPLASEIVTRFMSEAIRTSSTEGLAGLTGPVARGDKATVQEHLKAIRTHTPELLNLAIELIRTTVRLVRKEEIEEWEEILNAEL